MVQAARQRLFGPARLREHYDLIESNAATKAKFGHGVQPPLPTNRADRRAGSPLARSPEAIFTMM